MKYYMTMYPCCLCPGPANLNLCCSLIVAILSGSEFQSFIVLRKKEYRSVTVFAVVDGIVCFDI